MLELQTLTVWKACSPHAGERAPSEGMGTEEVQAKPWGKKGQLQRGQRIERAAESKQEGRRGGRRAWDG